MAKLSKASQVPRGRPPRKNVYEIPSDQEQSQDESDNSERDASPSDQLLREANTSPPSPPPNHTPERPAPSNKVPSSRKSVHFADHDDVAIESASLLRGPVRGRPKGKLVRPSSMPLPVITKVQPVQQTRPARKTQLEVGKSEPKKMDIRKSAGASAPLSPSVPEAGERRSGRSRQEVVTYSDKDTARLAAGLTNVTSLKQASKTRSTTPPASIQTSEEKHKGYHWGEEDDGILRQARAAGKSWENIQKLLPHRTLAALQGYASKHKIYLQRTNSASAEENSPPRQGTGQNSSPTTGTRAKSARITQQTSLPDHANGNNNEWSEWETATVKKLYEAGVSVEEMAKSLRGRSQGAIERRCRDLKNKSPSSTKKRRRVTNEAQTATGSAKRRRVQEQSASSASPLLESPTTSPVQARPNREQQGSSTSSKSARSKRDRRRTTSEEQTVLGTAKRRKAKESSTGSSLPLPSPLFQPQTGSTPIASPVQARPNRDQQKSIRQLEASKDLVERSIFQSDEIVEDEGAEEDDVRRRDTRDRTAEAHAMVQEEYAEEDGDVQDSGDENEAYRKDRNDSALDDMDDEDPDAPLTPRLFEQFGRIKRVVEAVISLQARIDELELRRPKEPLFEEFNTLRRQIRNSYKALVDPESEKDALEDRRVITTSVTKLQKLVKNLDPDSAPSRRRTLLKNIYAFLFPDLLKILATAAFNIVKRTESDRDISSPDLLEVSSIIRCIVNLGSRAPRWETKVDSELRLAKPVKNEIVAPLKKVLKTLEQQLRLVESEEQQAEASLRRTQEIRIDRAEKEAARRREHEMIPLRERLQELYMWRMHPSIETDLYLRTGHLAQPSSRRKEAYQLDANGDPFEREEVFTPRLSVPPIDHPDADPDADWSTEELDALQNGLAQIQPHDKKFWWKFYRRYCRSCAITWEDGSRSDVLRRRNVAELLREAVDFRNACIPDGGSRDDLPGWLLDIPDENLVPLL